MPVLRKKFSNGSVVVQETPDSGNVHITLSHGSYVFNPSGRGLIVERADVQDLADCLASLAKSPGGIIQIVATGVVAEWEED
jgi:hypothetical protein